MFKILRLFILMHALFLIVLSRIPIEFREISVIIALTQS